MIRKLISCVLCIIIMFSLSSCTGLDKTVQNSGTPLMEFDTRKTTKKLIESFENGNPPLSVYVIYDQMGSLPSSESTNIEYIRNIYNALSEIQVIGETQESITDCYHCAAFTFSDGTSAGFNFEGENILCIDNRNFKITNSDNLFTLIKTETLKSFEN